MDCRGWASSPARCLRRRCSTARPGTSRARTSEPTTTRRITMGTIGHVVWIALLMCLPVRLAGAQPDADPSGHWEGAVEARGKSVTIEVDLARNARGELIGTLGNPAEGEKGLPLATVVVAGREV